MNDDLEAPLEGVEEVVPTEAEQVEAPEAAESTEGQTQEATANGDEAEVPAEEPADKGPSRAERRRQAKERTEQALRDAEAKAAQAEADAKAIRDAAKAVQVPKQEDFATFEEWQAELSAHRTLGTLDDREARKREAEAKTHFETVQTIRQQQDAEDAQNWADQVVEGKAKYQDFEAVAMSDSVPITQDMARMLVQSDVAADVAYHLGKNPDVAAKISQLDPVNMARAMGRLEAQLSAPKPKTTSTAPDPITPVKGASFAHKSPGEMTPQEFAKWEEAGGKF